MDEMPTLAGKERRSPRDWPSSIGKVLALLSLLVPGCWPGPQPPAAPPAPPLVGAKDLDRAVCDFGIYWPPLDPQEAPPATAHALLNGTLFLAARPQGPDGVELRLLVTLTRPSTEADRKFWNTALAFNEFDWMHEVRQWDAERKWLWPNLPYLLRLFGKERVERYGGMDPGKFVDNDFAAVLIRKYDASGTAESPQTEAAPLVSAEWHPVGVSQTDLHALVHAARSDEFLVHLGGRDQPARGQLKVWLIYADFLNAKPPRTWPKLREWAGGILAYFEIDWETSADHNCRGLVRPLRPTQSTRFDWPKWVVRRRGDDESTASVKLRDDGGPSPGH